MTLFPSILPTSGLMLKTSEFFLNHFDQIKFNISMYYVTSSALLFPQLGEYLQKYQVTCNFNLFHMPVDMIMILELHLLCVM